jgi:hypothetical protein
LPGSHLAHLTSHDGHHHLKEHLHHLHHGVLAHHSLGGKAHGTTAVHAGSVRMLVTEVDIDVHVTMHQLISLSIEVLDPLSQKKQRMWYRSCKIEVSFVKKM